MVNTTTLELPARSLHGADLQTAVRLLQQQNTQTADVVVPVTSLKLVGGEFVLTGADPIVVQQAKIDENGVTPEVIADINGSYTPTRQADSQLGTLTGIPVPYMRRLRDEDVPLLDANVNAWTARGARKSKTGGYDADAKVLVRVLYGTDPQRPLSSGIVRAILSDRYGIRDNLDTVLATLDGMRQSGLGANNIRGLDLSDDKLYLRVEAPELAIDQPDWMSLYRSPFQGSGYGGETAERPRLVHCGLLVQNSETGNGAFSITPELRFQVCDNGAQCTWDAMRKVHLGARLDEGQIQWSSATRRAAKDLMREQVADAVAAFMSPEYMTAALERIGKDAGIEVADAAQTIKVVSKQMSYTDGEAALLLDHFIKGGLLTSGGVLHAVTSACQEIDDVDRANEFAGTGVAAMQAAARLAV